MDSNNEMPTVRINVTIPKETYDKLEEIEKRTDRTRSNVIKRLIEKYGDEI